MGFFGDLWDSITGKSSRDLAKDQLNLSKEQQARLEEYQADITKYAQEYAASLGIAVNNIKDFNATSKENIAAQITAYKTALDGLVSSFGVSIDEAQAAYSAASSQINSEAYKNSKDAIDAMSKAVAEEASKYESFVNGFTDEDGVFHEGMAGKTKEEINAVIDAFAVSQGASIASMTATMSSANEQLATDAANYINDYQQKLDDMAANSATQSAVVQAAYKAAIDEREAKVSGFVETFSQQTGEINAATQAAIKSVTDKYVADTGSISAGLAQSLNDLNESMSAKGEQISADLKTAIDQGNQALEAANAELGTAEQQVGAQANMAAGQSAVISAAAGQQAGNAAQQAARQQGMAGQAAGLMGVTEAARAQREAFMGSVESNRAAAQQAQQARLQAQQLAAQTGMDQAQALAAIEEAQRTGDFSQISANLNTGAQTQLDTAKSAADMQIEQQRKDQQAELDRMRSYFEAQKENANQSGADAIHAVDTMSAENQAETSRQSDVYKALMQEQLNQARAQQKADFEKAVKEQEEKAKLATEVKNSKVDSIENAANIALGAAKEVKDDKIKTAQQTAQDTLQVEKENAERAQRTAENTLNSETNQANTALQSGTSNATQNYSLLIGNEEKDLANKTSTELLALNGAKEQLEASKANAATQAGVAINSSNTALSAQNSANQVTESFVDKSLNALGNAAKAVITP
jgi:hypothetical protein